MKLTEHFTLEEFCESETAERMGRPIYAVEAIEFNLKRLCVELLEPIRQKLGLPIVITSGYRPLWLNRAIGGSITSMHMKGLAADIKVLGMSPDDFAHWVIDNGFVFDQCIFEGTWTHLGLAELGIKPRQQVLTAHFNGGKTTYTPGVPV